MSPKGIFDILPKESKSEEAWKESFRWQYLEEVMRSSAKIYGFQEIRTPIFEKTELFVRGVGDSSDIVSKEMYTFFDKGERSMTLRPEGTASVMRAIVQHKLFHPAKYFYMGPMFRYERPQAGRFRQHHQFGAEAVGFASPEQDVEAIDLLVHIYRRLGLKNLTVMINSLGDGDSLTSFKEALHVYLTSHLAQLSEESRVRFSKNILRILDSKETSDRQCLEGAPSILDYLSESSKDHFEKVKHLLSKMGIHFVVNPKLVRGLDYYNKTVFEVVSHELGAQNSIGGGGRYDGLIDHLGGPDLPAFGFATGLERVLQAMQGQHVYFPEPSAPLVFFIPLGQEAREKSFELVSTLRHHGVVAELDLSGKKIQHGLQVAQAQNAKYCIVMGEREIQEGKVELKEMRSRTTETVSLQGLTDKLLVNK